MKSMEERRKIAEDIKTGKYFAEAAVWYKSVFVYPLKEAGIMLFFASALGMLALIVLCYIYLLFPLEDKVTVVIPLRDTIHFFPKLIEVRDKYKSFKEIVIESLCKKYVQARESYIDYRFKANYAFVMRSSAKDIFEKYYEFITSSETNSPAVLNAKKRKEEVEVLSTEYNNHDNKATVVFKKSIYDQFGQLLTVSKWKADIKFYLSNYNFKEAVPSKLDFIVTHYIVSELKQ